MSPHFDPKKHLRKIGLANQTTMCAARDRGLHSISARLAYDGGHFSIR
jgi:hypothetical protein